MGLETGYLGKTLKNPDCITSRGPLTNGPDGLRVGSPVKYTFGAEYTEHYPTDGSPRTFYTTARVKWEDKDAFLAAILPDVYLGNEDAGQVLTLTPYSIDTNGNDARPIGPHRYPRRRCFRLPPEQHPFRRGVYAVDASVLRGEGYISSAGRDRGQQQPVEGRQFLPPHWPHFKTQRAAEVWPQETVVPEGNEEDVPHQQDVPAVASYDGYVMIGIVWKDLPYETLLIEDDLNSPNAGQYLSWEASNTKVNQSEYCELSRYCIIRPSVRGSHLPIPSQQAVFINDNGQILKNNSNIPVKLAEAQPFFVPAMTFSVVWKMVPRVPRAATLLQGCCNEVDDLWSIGIYEEAGPPEVGTLMYLGYELSDPYRTVTDRRVVDITYNFGYRPSGSGPYRGWNSTYCPTIRDFARIVFGSATNDDRVVTSSNKNIVLPVTSVDGDQETRRTTKEACTYPFAILKNLFRFTSRFGELS
jgi:hypothetical protein